MSHFVLTLFSFLLLFLFQSVPAAAQDTKKPAAPEANPWGCYQCHKSCLKQEKKCKKAIPKKLCKGKFKALCHVAKNIACPKGRYVCEKISCEMSPDCKAPVPEPDSPSPKTPGGGAFGEPHIKSLDGMTYHLQAIGEFVAARTKDMEIQFRFEKVLAHTSAVTAISIRVGGHTIIFLNKNNIRIDGESVQVTDMGLPINADIGISRVETDLYLVYTKQGDIWVHTKRYMAMNFDPTPDTAGVWVGLLGDFDGNGDNDLRSKSGEVYDLIGIDKNTLYHQFAKSWRVSQQESILPYEEGENTETFTDLAFPPEEFSIASMDPTTYDKVRKQCIAAGVLSSDSLENCIYDLGATGDAAFLDTYTGSFGRFLEGTSTFLALSTEATLKLRLQSQGLPGETVPFFLSGQPSQSGFLQITDSEGKAVGRVAGKDLNKKRLQLPETAGDYTVSYLHEGNAVSSQSIKILVVKASLEAPSSAIAGSLLDVRFNNLGQKYDYIDIVPKGYTDTSGELRYGYVKMRTNLSIQSPFLPGSYQVRYIAGKNKTVLVTKALEISPVKASLTVPNAVSGAEVFTVQWTGPNYPNDYIAILKSGTPITRQQLAYLRADAAENTFQAPATPGRYDVHYILASPRERISLAKKTITVSAPEVSLKASDKAASGGELSVQWTGPGGKSDYIDIVPRGYKTTTGELSYGYTKSGAILKIALPAQVGDYELRYVADTAEGKIVIHSQALRLEDVKVTLSLDDSVKVQTKFEIVSTGPNSHGDYLKIVKKGQSDKYVSRSYNVSDKQKLSSPKEPGEYEVLYVLRGASLSERIIARKSFTVTP